MVLLLLHKNRKSGNQKSESDNQQPVLKMLLFFVIYTFVSNPKT